MRKLPNIATSLLATALLFAGSAAAQQTPAANSQTAPPASSSPAATKTQTGASTPAAGTTKTQSGTATHHTAAAPLVLKTDKEKRSYAIGMNIAKNLQRDGIEVDPAILLRGLKDTQAGGKLALSDDEAKTVMLALTAELRKAAAEKAQAAAAQAQVAGEANKKAGEAFLAENKTKEGVVTLPDGLQYKILSEGTGAKPAATDTVVCNYKGTLLDNTEFDSSYKHNQPLTIPVNALIKGWTEALQLMPVGSKWQLFIPSNLAYGPQQKGPIGPNSMLIFEVELLSIQDKNSSAQPAKPAPADDTVILPH